MLMSSQNYVWGEQSQSVETHIYFWQVTNSPWLLHEMKSNFGESLRLKISDDSLSTKARMTHHLHNLPIALVLERELKESLSGVDSNDLTRAHDFVVVVDVVEALELLYSGDPSNLSHLNLPITIDAEHLLLVNLRYVNRLFESSDDSSIPVCETVLDMVDGGVDEDISTAVPRS